MQKFQEGDRVRIDIPDTSDPDHDTYHGKHGTIIGILEDAGDYVTGDEREKHLYRVELEPGDRADFRWRDLRPPIE